MDKQNKNKNKHTLTSLQAWQAIRKLESRSKTLSSLALNTPQHGLRPACSDGRFKTWEDRGILILGHLFDNGVMLRPTFEQLQQKYGLPRNRFFLKIYLQICSFIQNLSS